MPQAPWGLHTNWLSCFLVNEERVGCSSDWLIQQLAAADIESRPVWKPMHLQQLYAGSSYFGGRVAEDLSLRGICLPSSSGLSAEEQSRVIEALTVAVRQARETRARRAS
jgi:pyridoxal phosphate-dependent aminotransferase EpsN